MNRVGEKKDGEAVNIAYLDAANLDKALKNDLAWKLDYKRFRVWLKEKYDVEKAYLFIGLIPKYRDLYTYLRTGAPIVYLNDKRHQLERVQK